MNQPNRDWLTVSFERNVGLCIWQLIIAAISLFIAVMLLRAVYFAFTKVHLLKYDQPSSLSIAQISKGHDPADPWPSTLSSPWKWRSPATRRKLQNGFSRYLRAITSNLIPILIRGKSWFETMRLTPSNSGAWDRLDFANELGVYSLTQPPGQRKITGLYLRANKKGKPELWWAGHTGFIEVLDSDIDEAVDELRRLEDTPDDDEGRTLTRRRVIPPKKLTSGTTLLSTRAHNEEEGKTVGYRIDP